MDPVLIGELLSGLMFFGIIGFLLLGFGLEDGLE